jgi:hypothetical protein
MQLRRNPSGQERIDAIFASAHILEKQSPIVLDLGILGADREFLEGGSATKNHSQSTLAWTRIP